MIETESLKWIFRAISDWQSFNCPYFLSNLDALTVFYNLFIYLFYKKEDLAGKYTASTSKLECVKKTSLKGETSYIQQQLKSANKPISWT